MSTWICCNSCFLSVSADRKLAVTTCGHITCSVCYQKGKQGKCLICNAKCQVSPLSVKSNSEVKALFSDINVMATKHFTEVSKVLMFQARHQNRLLNHYQKRNEKLEEVLVKMKQEMHQMTKKLNEQSAYISKLETSLQHQSIQASSASQIRHSSPHGPKPACSTKPETSPGPDKLGKYSSYWSVAVAYILQIQFNSPVSLSRHSSVTSVVENMDVDERSPFRKPNTVPRLSLINPPQDGRMGTVSHRSFSHSTLANQSARSATVSRFQGTSMTPDISYGHSSGWKSPVFKPPPPSSFRHSMSSLHVRPPP